MLFDAVLTPLVENITFIPMKIILGTNLGPFFAKKGGFWKGNL
jgi:hypothetical protein